jgi:dihydroneopterin aldolase
VNGDRIDITDLEVNCIVGVFPAERDTAQPVWVDLELAVDVRAAALNEELSATVDYGRLAGDVRFLLERCRFTLLETAAEVLARYLLLPALGAQHPQVTQATVRVRKPRALVGAAVAGVQIARTLADAGTPAQARAYGAAEPIFLGRDCSVERRRVNAGARIGPFTHARGEAHELVVADGMTVNGARVPAGSAYAFQQGQARAYEAGASEQALLCVRRPADLADVDAPHAELHAARASVYAAPGALLAPRRARKR